MSISLSVSLDVTAVPANPAGAGRYIVELARGLSAGSAVDLSLISRVDDVDRWHNAGIVRVLNKAPRSRPLRLLWEQLALPRVLGSIGVDVHHAPHYTMSERAKVRQVVTIHDMTFFEQPQWHERSKVAVFRRAINVAARRADALVAVSHDTKARLQSRFDSLPPITVIPHGVDHSRFQAQATLGEQVALEELGVGARFIVCVGTLEPRKDIVSLVRAFDVLADEDNSLQLVLAGSRGWGLGAIDAAIDAARHGQRIRTLGFVDDGLIPVLLRQATAVAYPSRAEGFGLPALEALACAAPLVTTTGSAPEEVVEDAALLVPPHDVAALAEALQKLLHDSALVARLRLRGPQVAAQYTWERSVARHIELYQTVSEH